MAALSHQALTHHLPAHHLSHLPAHHLSHSQYHLDHLQYFQLHFPLPSVVLYTLWLANSLSMMPTRSHCSMPCSLSKEVSRGSEAFEGYWLTAWAWPVLEELNLYPQNQADHCCYYDHLKQAFLYSWAGQAWVGNWHQWTDCCCFLVCCCYLVYS